MPQPLHVARRVGSSWAAHVPWSGMREHRFLADDETCEALRALAAPWASHSVADSQIEVRLRGGLVVRLHADGREIEPGLHGVRLHASVVGQHALETSDAYFPDGVSGIMLLASETWSDDASRPADATASRTAAQRTGAPGTRPGEAAAVCTMTDAVWLQGTNSRQLVVYCVRPHGVRISRDDDEIAELCSAHRGVPLAIRRG